MPHLTTIQREDLYALKREHFSQADIAERIGVSQPTVSRELTRNRAGPRLGYLPDRADAIAKQRRAMAKNKVPCWQDHQPLLDYVIAKLTDKEHWSPEQISGRLRKDYPQDPQMQIAHESIYKHIWHDKRAGGTLHLNLRNRGRPHKKRGQKDRRGTIPNRRDISTRPQEADSKQIIGHFESDLIIGSQTGKDAILTIVERKTKKIFGGKLRRTAEAVGKRAIKIFNKIPTQLRKTNTHDNGKEIAQHEKITKKTGVDVYCARPYCSGDRGLNELSNRFIRQYFPKGTDFDIVSDRAVQVVIEAINNRPRKILNYRTPNEAFAEEEIELCVSG